MNFGLHRHRGTVSRPSPGHSTPPIPLRRPDLEDTGPLHLPHPLFSDHTGGDYELAQAWWDGYGAGHLDAVEHPPETSLCPYD